MFQRTNSIWRRLWPLVLLAVLPPALLLVFSAVNGTEPTLTFWVLLSLTLGALPWILPYLDDKPTATMEAPIRAARREQPAFRETPPHDSCDSAPRR